MAKVNEKVMAMVEAAIARDPTVTVDELYKRAKSAVPSIGRLNKRQFHARYPLQVKRRKSGGGAKKAKRVTAAKKPRKTARRARTAPAVRASANDDKSNADRDAIRAQFLQFATDLTAADQRQDLVKVLARVDRYVDAVVKAAGAA